MGLKTIFQMTKTDRYTQDGRDELAKLQETEDVKYKTGDISQKTGLQKQPDGSWAPPKGGAAPKMGSPEYNEKYGLTKRDVATGNEIDRIYEKHQKRIKELKAKGYTDEQIENDKIYQQTKEDMRNVGKNKPAAKKKAGSINRTPERINKEVKIMEALNLPTDNKLHEMSDETIEMLYKKSQETKPAPKKEAPKRNYEAEVDQIMEKYKDLPGLQKKDAIYAETLKGSSIGTTQEMMERQGWDLLESDDKINVYGKPDGSRVHMQHNGEDITKVDYQASPEITRAQDYIKKYAGKTINGKPIQDIKIKDDGNRSGLFVFEFDAGDEKYQMAYDIGYGGKQDKPSIKKISSDSAPRILTGDTKIRIRK